MKCFFKIKYYFLLFLLSITYSSSAQKNIKELDNLSSFSFSIISDNKGYALENEHMKKCDQWIRESNDKFVLGLGDHVKINRKNLFLDLIKNDSLWHNHFYPNVADGENEYWGTGQGDWGAGAPIIDYTGLAKRANVHIRKNNCEYYAIEKVNGINIHIIQLHYSDTPKSPKKAFNKNTRNYLLKVLESIHKTENDIIIILAHTDNWIKLFKKKKRKRIVSKADLILDATTHIFKKYDFSKKYFDKGAIIFNTGSVGNSNEEGNGFLQIHVLKKPLRMIIQYQNTGNDSRTLQSKNFVFEKIINGATREIDWKVNTINNVLQQPKNGNTFVIAHRGAHIGIPENTLAAYQKAIDLGCDFIEIDIRKTKDGKFVSVHDSTIDAYTEGEITGKVANFTLEELKQINIGKRVGAEWEKERIPTFEEILQLCKGKIGIYLDLKEPNVKELVDIIRQYDMEKDIIWYIPASYLDAIKQLKNYCPQCIPMPDPGAKENIKKVVKAVQPSIISTDMGALNKEYMKLAKKYKLKVIVDEKKGTKKEWSKIIKLGTDGIQTDNPALLIKYLTN